MIPDVRLQRAGRDIFCVWDAVGFDLVGFAFYQFCGRFKIPDRVVKTSERNISMSAMAEPGGSRIPKRNLPLA